TGNCGVVKLTQFRMAAFSFFGQHNRNNLHALLDAVERNYVAEKHPDGVDRSIERLRTIISKRWLKPLRSVVPKISNGASSKRCQSRATRQHSFTKIISHPFSGDARKDFCR